MKLTKDLAIEAVIAVAALSLGVGYVITSAVHVFDGDLFGYSLQMKDKPLLLDADARREFVTASFSTCINTQQSLAHTGGVKAGSIKSYCSCFANAAAAAATRDDLDYYRDHNHPSAHLSYWAKMVAPMCAETAQRALAWSGSADLAQRSH